MISSPTEARVVHLHDSADAMTAHRLWTLTLQTATHIITFYSQLVTAGGAVPPPPAAIKP